MIISGVCQPCEECWRDENRNRIASSVLGTSKFRPYFLHASCHSGLGILFSVFRCYGFQINHMYEERRLLVAQSCGELAEFVRPEIRDSLILSIVQQLVEDSATIVREDAVHNLAKLLPLFPNMDKYFKVSLTISASRKPWRRFLT